MAIAACGVPDQHSITPTLHHSVCAPEFIGFMPPLWGWGSPDVVSYFFGGTSGQVMEHTVPLTAA